MQMNILSQSQVGLARTLLLILDNMSRLSDYITSLKVDNQFGKLSAGYNIYRAINASFQFLQMTTL